MTARPTGRPAGGSGDGVGTGVLWASLLLLGLLGIGIARLRRAAWRRLQKRRFAWQRGDLGPADGTADRGALAGGADAPNPFPLSVDLDPVEDLDDMAPDTCFAAFVAALEAKASASDVRYERTAGMDVYTASGK